MTRVFARRLGVLVLMAGTAFAGEAPDAFRAYVAKREDFDRRYYLCQHEQAKTTRPTPSDAERQRELAGLSADLQKLLQGSIHFQGKPAGSIGILEPIFDCSGTPVDGLMYRFARNRYLFVTDDRLLQGKFGNDDVAVAEAALADEAAITSFGEIPDVSSHPFDKAKAYVIAHAQDEASPDRLLIVARKGRRLYATEIFSSQEPSLGETVPACRKTCEPCEQGHAADSCLKTCYACEGNHRRNDPRIRQAALTFLDQLRVTGGEK